MKTLLIVGGATQTASNRRLPRGWTDLWTFLSIADPVLVNQATMVWDCHDHLSWEDVPNYKRCDIRRDARLRDLLLDEHGPRFSSQGAWMMAAALQWGYTTIMLWRMYTDLTESDRIMGETLDMMYFIGKAHAQGVTVIVDPSSVFLHPVKYGLGG